MGTYGAILLAKCVCGLFLFKQSVLKWDWAVISVLHDLWENCCHVLFFSLTWSSDVYFFYGYLSLSVFYGFIYIYIYVMCHFHYLSSQCYLVFSRTCVICNGSMCSHFTFVTCNSASPGWGKSTPRSVLDMTLNFIQLWSSGHSEVPPPNPNPPRPTLTPNGSSC